MKLVENEFNNAILGWSRIIKFGYSCSDGLKSRTRWSRIHVGSKVKWREFVELIRASEQQIEVSQQSVYIGEWSSPVVEGGKLLQLSLPRWRNDKHHHQAHLINPNQQEKLRNVTSSSWLHFLDVLSLVKTDWGSVKPRSSSSDRSSSGIGCLQNRKESYWLLDFSIMSDWNETENGQINSMYLQFGF